MTREQSNSRIQRNILPQPGHTILRPVCWLFGHEMVEEGTTTNNGLVRAATDYCERCGHGSPVLDGGMDDG
jgi:hypothetical protein